MWTGNRIIPSDNEFKLGKVSEMFQFEAPREINISEGMISVKIPKFRTHSAEWKMGVT